VADACGAEQRIVMPVLQRVDDGEDRLVLRQGAGLAFERGDTKADLVGAVAARRVPAAGP
jgi:hypothetical protein